MLVIILILEQYMGQSICVCVTNQVPGPLGWDFWPLASSTSYTMSSLLCQVIVEGVDFNVTDLLIILLSKEDL